MENSKRESNFARTRDNSPTKKQQSRINALKREITDYYNRVLHILKKVDQNFETRFDIMQSKVEVDFEKVLVDFSLEFQEEIDEFWQSMTNIHIIEINTF